MPFTMTHLIISKNISELLESQVDSLPQFYLGSVAPDAVHNRTNYVSDNKKDSHLITGSEKWGMTTDNDRWKNDIVSFLKKHQNSEHHDFILGYCSHVVVDMYNNITIWTPFRLKHNIDLDFGYDNIHHRESNKIDIELALIYDGRNEFWSNLASSRSIDIPPIIYADEIDIQKDKILNVWFKNKERQDLSSNTEKTIESELAFIKNATDYVAQFFDEFL